MSKRFKLSKIERKKFRFTGVDVVQKEDRIEVSMEEYAKSLEKITHFRKAKAEDLLTEEELKIYRKYVGNFQWLAGLAGGLPAVPPHPPA